MGKKLAASVSLILGIYAGEVLHLKGGERQTGGLGGSIIGGMPVAGKRLVEGKTRVIVQYAAPPGEAEMGVLNVLGGVVLGVVPEDGLLVSLPDEARVELLYPGAVFLGRLRLEDKVSKWLGEAPGWMAVEYFNDVTSGQRAVLGGRRIWGTRKDAAALAEWDEVAYVYPAGGQEEGTACSNGGLGMYVASSGASWAGAGKVGYFVERSPGDVEANHLAAGTEVAMAAALKEWARYSNLEFLEAGSSADWRTLNLKLAAGEHGDGIPFDGPGGVLAHTFYPVPVNGEPVAGDIHLDLAEKWTAADLYSVILHEVGHGLGFVHADFPGSVMYPMYRRVSGLGAADIAAVRESYGTRVVAEEAGEQELGLDVTAVLRNVADFPPGELVAIAGKAWGGGGGLKVRWRYAGGRDWTAVPGAFEWLAPMVPVFGVDVDVVVEVTDGMGRTVERTVSIVAKEE